MSEPMSEQRDPIRQLESFAAGARNMSPVAPSEIRRLGNRRRARRRAATVLAAAGVVLAVVVPLGFALGDGPDSTPPITRTPSPSPTSTTTPPPAEITYPGAGVTVKTAADTAKLTGTTPAFRTFIAHQLGAIPGPASCAEIDVQKYSSVGYAIGAVGGCGAYKALWVSSELNDGAWGEGQGTQDTWDCDALSYLQVPTSFAGPCADEAGTFATPGAGGPEPGMSKAQLAALGLTVSGPVAGADPTNCPGVAYRTAVMPSEDVGLWDPQDGLVDVAATTTMKTAERIGLGSPRSKVVAAYPQGHRDQSGDYTVPRSSATTLFIRFRRGMVVAMSWRLSPKHCDAWMP